MQLKFAFFFPLSVVRFSHKTQWSTHEKNEENHKIGSRNLPKNDHMKSRTDAERTISRFVDCRTCTLPFFILKGPALFALKLVCL